MSAGGDDLVTLALALLKRGASPGQILDVMGEAGGETERPTQRGKPGPKPGSSAGGSPPRHVSHAHVLAALRDASGPITAHQLVALLPALTLPAAFRHMNRGIEIGSIVRTRDTKPYTYVISSVGRQRAADAEKQAASSASVVPSTGGEGHGGHLSHAQLLATIGRLRGATTATLRDAHPHATRTSIYQHLTRGVESGELSRTGKKNNAIYSLKAAGVKVVAGSATKIPVVKEGTRLEAICTVLRKAGRPMRVREIWEKGFSEMRLGTVEQHVIIGQKKGVLARSNFKPYEYTISAAAAKVRQTKPAKETKPKKAAPKGSLKGDRFIVELRKQPGPLRSKEIYKLFPDVHPHSVDTCLSNRVKDLSVIRIGKTKPFTYQAKSAPAAVAPVAKNMGHANGTPTATA